MSRDDDRNTRGSRDTGRGRDDDRDRDRGRDSGRDSGRGRDDDRSRDREPSRDRDRDSGRSGSGRGGFSYQGRTREDIEKRQTYDSDFDRIFKPGVRIWKPKNGSNRIRLVPATWANAKHYGYDIHVHYGVGPDRGTYLDLSKMKDEADPIAEEYNELKRDGRATDEELRALKSSQRVAVYLIDRDNEEEGVQAYAMSKTMDIDIAVLSEDKSTNELLNIDHPDEGYDVEFNKSGEGLKTKYSGVAISRRSSPLGKDKWLEWAVANPLPEMLQFYTYAEIAKVFGGGGVQRERDRSGRDDETRGRGRDSDDHSTSRGEERHGSRENDDDRDRGRGTRDRGEDRGRGDDAPSRGRGRDEGGRDASPSLTWETIHDMTSSELDALVGSDDRLDKIKPNDASTDVELADWICEDLGLKKTEARGRRAVTPADDGGEDRLAKMREERGRR